ncbi:MAG TPA: four helix bundle protein, partial [Candidatus Atribacteria bacterium]|nr:four helix bundle protein [Candidatus Atribacteria bacterium]
YQLSKAATSIGANYTESQAGSTKEFYSRINIC